MVKEIITDLEKLSDRCDEIDVRKENQLMRDIILDLKQTLRENPTGVGLAANQIGYNKRIFIINFNGDLRTFINPVISQVKGFTLNRESCLSLPGKSFIRPRHNEIMVIYQTPLGKTESRKIVGLAAYVFQHELDHLDGLTLADIGLEVGEDFDKATDEERNEVINAYLDSLDIKQTANAIKFMEAIQKGEVKLDDRVTVEKKKEE